MSLRRNCRPLRSLWGAWLEKSSQRSIENNELDDSRALSGMNYQIPLSVSHTDSDSKMIHSVALLVAEQAAPRNTWAKSFFVAGMTMFSGSIYCLVLDPARFRWMGPVTPIGGTCFIAGWIALAIGSRARVALS